jgi:hypothetical protein
VIGFVLGGVIVAVVYVSIPEHVCGTPGDVHFMCRSFAGHTYTSAGQFYDSLPRGSDHWLGST